jgi:hypothetical protein
VARAGDNAASQLPLDGGAKRRLDRPLVGAPELRDGVLAPVLD